MASSSSRCHGAAAAKHRRVLIRFTCDGLRIPDELAAEIAAEEAVVVGPHSKVWRVGVGWDADGAFLGRAFADACGVKLGWLLVLRHRGNGLLTLKAFDGDRCRTELGAQTTAPAASVEATTYYTGASCKPQFINVFSTNSMGKMLIPSRFVQHYMHKEHLNNRVAIISGPLGKVYPIELEMNRSDMFFAAGWSQFVAFPGITEADVLLLRYEDNMAFTVEVFGPDGCQRESMHKDGRMQPNELEITSTLKDTERQHEISSASSRKFKSINNWPYTDEQRMPKGFVTCSKKKKNKSSETNCAYNLGPPAWLTKTMNASMMSKHHLDMASNTSANKLNYLRDIGAVWLPATTCQRTVTRATAQSLPRPFCNAVGFQKPCMITLQGPMGSTSSWQVRGLPYKNGSCQLGSGWKKVCRDIGLKNGDVITLKVIKTTLWHVIITRS